MKRKKFYFNDGLDGVVVAKSLNQAINILCKNGYDKMKHEIKKGIKTDKQQGNGFWSAYCFKTREKTGMKGWDE